MSDSYKPKILVVDDERALLVAVTETLRDYDFLTTGFSTASEALQALEREEFDLLLSDLMMPEMDGITLMKRVLEMRPEMAVVIMTGQGTVETAVEAMKSGALDFILKPFKASAAVPVLNRSLEIRRLRQANTELLRREREYTKELEVRNNELSTFCRAVAHDLRTPVGHVSGFTSILDFRYRQLLDKDGNEALQSLMNASRTMINMIEGMLDLARVTDTKTDLVEVDFSQVAGVVSSELRQFRPEYAAEVKIEPGLKAVADPRFLEIALRNLIGNALKFTTHVSRAQINVGRDISKKNRPFYVKDNGPGFDPGRASDLFLPFERLHSEEEFEGTGIGLSTVYRVMERHGGSIWAESRPGEGATFYFTLEPLENGIHTA
ncbi:MAG: response regulator [bacterium]